MICQLPGGLRLTVVTADTEISAYALAWRNGFRAEAEGQAGFAHLCEHMLFEQTFGSTRLSYHEAVNRAGGAATAQTRCDYTVFTSSCDPRNLAALLQTEAERFSAPRFSDSVIRKQVAIIGNEIREKSGAVAPVVAHWNTIPSCLFNDFAHAHDGWGSIEDIDTVTTESLAAFYDENFRTSDAALAVVGPYDMDEVLASIPHEFRTSPVPTSSARPAPQPDAEARHRTYPGTRNAVSWVLPGLDDDAVDITDWIALSCLIEHRMRSFESSSRVEFGMFDDPLQLDNPRYLSVNWPSSSQLTAKRVLTCVERIATAGGTESDPMRTERGRSLFLDDERSRHDPRGLAGRLAARTLVSLPPARRTVADVIRRHDLAGVHTTAAALLETRFGALEGTG